MATVITSGGFWPEDIKPSIQTPLAILAPRADELTRQTKGVLVGSVSTTTSEDESWVFHNLDVTVPALNNLRQRLLTIKHRADVLYPAYVEAEYFQTILERVARQLADSTIQIQNLLQSKKEKNEASSDDELVILLKQALHSHQIKTALVNLIAQANEAVEQRNGESAKNTADEQSNQDSEPEKPQQ